MDAEFLTKLNWLNAVSAQCRTGGEDAPAPEFKLRVVPALTHGTPANPNQCEVPGCTKKKLSDLSTCFDCEYLKSRRCPNWDDCHGIRSFDSKRGVLNPSCKECHQVELKKARECPNHLQCGGYRRAKPGGVVSTAHGGRSEPTFFDVCPACHKEELKDRECPNELCDGYRREKPDGSGLFDICPKCYKEELDSRRCPYYDYCKNHRAKNWKTGQLYEMCRDCYNYVE